MRASSSGIAADHRANIECAPISLLSSLRLVVGVFESLLLLQPFKPAQQQTDVFRQLFLHDVAGCLAQGLADFVEEDQVGQLRVFWPGAQAD
jgi:hypothetical protein